jgi:hypothetical protein
MMAQKENLDLSEDSPSLYKANDPKLINSIGVCSARRFNLSWHYAP